MGTAIDSSALKSPRVILRIIETLFSFLVMALSAAVIDKIGGRLGGFADSVNFSLFVGLTSMLLCFAILALYLLGKNGNKLILVIEFVATAVYWIFWLAAATATTDDIRVLDRFNVSGTTADTARANCAFCWLTFFLWCGSLFYCIWEDIKERKIFSSSGGAAPTGAAVQSPPMSAPAAVV